MPGTFGGEGVVLHQNQPSNQERFSISDNSFHNKGLVHPASSITASEGGGMMSFNPSNLNKASGFGQ